MNLIYSTIILAIVCLVYFLLTKKYREKIQVLQVQLDEFENRCIAYDRLFDLIYLLSKEEEVKQAIKNVRLQESHRRTLVKKISLINQKKQKPTEEYRFIQEFQKDQ